MSRIIRWYDYITINIYWFALTTRSQVITPLIVPLLVQQFVGEESKGSLVGNMRLWALLIAILVQALMGMISDRSTLRWGRRRPFIVAGTFGEVIIFAMIGFIAGWEGMSGYWALFGLYVFSMVTANMAHAATQGLIPDLVPEDMRGRFSGFKAFLELPVPLIFVSFVLGKMISNGNLTGAIYVLMAVMVICMLIAMFIPEDQQKKVQESRNWNPFFRLVLMTAAFAFVILGVGFAVNTIMSAISAFEHSLQAIIIGVLGVLGMGTAVGFGVWLSVSINLGDSVSEHSSFTWWVINRLAFLVGATNLAGFMVYFLQDRFNEFSGEQAAAPASRIVMFVGVFILLSALPSGWLVDKFGKKRLIAASAFLTAGGTIIVLLSSALSGIYAGSCFVGAGIGVFYTANWALGTDIVPKEEAGRFLGLSNLAGAGAGAVGAYIGGPIADNVGYVTLFAIYAAMILISLIPLSRIQEKTI